MGNIVCREKVTRPLIESTQPIDRSHPQLGRCTPRTITRLQHTSRRYRDIQSKKTRVLFQPQRSSVPSTKLETLVVAACLIESLQPRDDRVQSREPFVQILVELVLGDRNSACRIGRELLEELCPVWAGFQRDLWHGEQIDSIKGAAKTSTHREDALDHAVVVLP